MKEITPDYWVALNVKNIDTKEQHIRLFAYWGNEYWRVSSKVVLMSYEDEVTKFITSSGTVYLCPISNRKCNKTMQNLIEAWKFSKRDKYKVTYD